VGERSERADGHSSEQAHRRSASGLVLVDKPAGWTSHDVVGRVRRLARTRRVGHAGTLDPMATGVLVLGVDRATRLLGHLALHDKSYLATIRLGQSTLTDDAEGDVLQAASAAAVTEEGVRAGLAGMTGEIDQVPAAVSAIKVAGQRSYARVRAGERPDLPARRVTIDELELLALRRPGPDLLDCDVAVTCSSGTYVRAIARDLGAALGVGGHLTALRRTRVGGYRLADCRRLEELAELPDPVTIGLDEAVSAGFARRDVGAEHARLLAHGGRLAPAGITGTYGVFGPDGAVVALVEERDGAGRPVVVLRPA
jgi:tRNA pseudouridine55 synthase